jgi:hypothetical protein
MSSKPAFVCAACIIMLALSLSLFAIAPTAVQAQAPNASANSPDPLLTNPIFSGNHLINLANAYDGSVITKTAFAGGCPCIGSGLTLDFGSLKNISTIRLYIADVYFSGLIQYSLDGSRWETALSTTLSAGAWQQ